MVPIASVQLQKHVNVLAGEIGERNVFRPKALQAAAQYLEEEWCRQGYEVVAQPYNADGINCANLEITRLGSDPDAGIILLGAHYDSVYGSPGANDNGSGIAALLELSRLFQTQRTQAALRFVAFVNEEPPFFYGPNMGSLVYARQARSRGDRLRMMISLETLGYYLNTPGSQRYPPLLKYFYPNRGNFVAFVSNMGSRRALRACVKAFRTGSGFPVEYAAAPAFLPGIAWSDQSSFWRCGFPAIMITDTAPFRYPYYHSAADTPDKLHYPAFAEVANGLAAMLARVADS